ncbi:MAG: hypothetical protein RL038_331 [Actinomycetota bacterium]
MAKVFQQKFQVDLPLRDAISRLSSKEFLKQVISSSEPLESNLKVKHSNQKFEVEISRKFALELDGPIAAAAGKSITLNEHRSWEITDSNTAVGNYEATAIEQPITLAGSMQATATADASCVIDFDLVLRCSIPFFGGMVEKFAMEYLGEVIELELKALNS